MKNYTITVNGNVYEVTVESMSMVMQAMYLSAVPLSPQRIRGFGSLGHKESLT